MTRQRSSAAEIAPETAVAPRCDLCETEPGIWLMFGDRKFCSACSYAWKTADAWPADKARGSFAPVFEAWFAEKRKERRR